MTRVGTLVARLVEQLGYELGRRDEVPWRVCRVCGYTWARDVVSADIDEDGRFVGWLCEDCR